MRSILHEPLKYFYSWQQESEDSIYETTSFGNILGPWIQPATPCLCNSSIVSMGESVMHNTFRRKYLLFSTPARICFNVYFYHVCNPHKTKLVEGQGGFPFCNWTGTGLTGYGKSFADAILKAEGAR